MAGWSLARGALKVSAAAGDSVRRVDPGVVVLVYHRVGTGCGVELDLPGERFERQMAWLGASGRATTLDDALGHLEHTSPRPAHLPRPVVVTFDDGTADFADVAVPILERHRVPATVYVATDFVERGREFPYGGRPLSWGALRDALGTNLVTVGSHTHTHALLDRLAPAAVEDELARSCTLIEDRLGVRAEHFAYPKALRATGPGEHAVRHRFRSAAVAGTRSNRPGSTDPHRLARSPVQHSDGMRWFHRKANGGMRLEDDLRRVVNRLRYTGATN